jgi:uncharacterized RDD family membrane protein YckC
MNEAFTNDDTAKEDLLVFEEHPLFQFTLATQWQRFANWLIDNLLMRYGLSYFTGIAVGFIISELAPEAFYSFIRDNGAGAVILLLYLMGVINYLIYYTLCEKLFRGYTLGKLITGTRAIRQDGQELTFKNALLRSLSRLVPFEVLSGFSPMTWHDQWSGTMVVQSR